VANRLTRALNRLFGVEEQRAITSIPWNVGPTRFDSVTVTQDKALSLAPVYAAVRFLTSAATLPLKAYRKVGEQREPMANLPQLFQFMIEDGTLVDWLTRAFAGLALHGNALGVITSRDGFEFPTSVVWRPQHEFWVDDTTTPFRPQWYWNGRRIERSEIVHIPWLTVPGRTMGLSPLEHAALTVSGGLEAQTYGNDWFAAGGIPPGTFKNTEQTVSMTHAREIKARLTEAIRTHEPLVYGKDWDFNPLAIPPEQAQFVSSQNLTANQVAAFFGIAPEEVGGVPANSLTYNTEELRETRRMSDLRPWLVRMETGVSALLPERQYMKFNTAAVIRADLRTRHQVYQIDRNIGLLNMDEIRALEDLPPLPDGQGQDYTPLTNAAAQTPQIEPPADEESSARIWRMPA